MNGHTKKGRKVVVIAASAGGIDAVAGVLSHLPSDLPAAVLVVQHLQSNRKTNLPEFLSRHASLRVCLAQDGMPLEDGVVYIAPPGQHLCVDNERLILNSEALVHYVRPSADVLFISVSQIFGCDVIGVVLSGTGRDGASGCKAIRENGGVTIAQDAKTSTYFDMPKAAITANAIDYILPLHEIAGKIIELIRGV